MADTCQLYLVRHAIAEERGPEYPDDAKRPLTSKGMAKFRRVARGLASLDVQVDVVLTSPLVRARQTAEILAQYLPGRPPIVETAALSPGATAAELTAELANHSRKSGVAVVGHEPGIGALAARLIGSKGEVVFRKGAVCRIDVDALPPTGAGRLAWFAPPKFLSKLDR